MSCAAARLSSLLVPHGATIAVAESSAGGLIAAKLLSVAGASKFFRGGVVCYSAHSKEALLALATKAPTATEAHALAMAAAARRRLGSAGASARRVWPGKNSRGAAPGCCAIAVAGPDGFERTVMLWPDDSLGANDAYGQPPLLSREERMSVFCAAEPSIWRCRVRRPCTGETSSRRCVPLTSASPAPRLRGKSSAIRGGRAEYVCTPPSKVGPHRTPRGQAPCT